MTQGQFLSGVKQILIQSFPSPRLAASPRLKAEEPTLPYYLPIAGGRIIGFIPFPRVLVLCEMQSVLSRIWTRVAVSISYEDNHYSTGTSFSNTSLPLYSDPPRLGVETPDRVTSVGQIVLFHIWSMCNKWLALNWIVRKKLFGNSSNWKRMTNWIVSDTLQYLKSFNSVQTNEWCWIELLVIKSSNWSSLTKCQNLIIGIT